MDKFEPKFACLQEDHVFSYHNRIHRLIDKFNTAIENEYAIKNEFVVIAWHKIRPGLWFTVERVKSFTQFHKGYYKKGNYDCLYYEQYQEWPSYGEQFYFENVRGIREWGMLISRGSYKKCQLRLEQFMESARLKPILIHDPNTETGISEMTILDKECLNLRLDFYTGENPLKRKLDEMEFIIND